MSQKIEVVYVVTYESKIEGEWKKLGRVFLHHSDAEKEIETLSWFAQQRRPIIRKFPAKPEVMVMYM